MKTYPEVRFYWAPGRYFRLFWVLPDSNISLYLSFQGELPLLPPPPVPTCGWAGPPTTAKTVAPMIGDCLFLADLFKRQWTTKSPACYPGAEAICRRKMGIMLPTQGFGWHAFHIPDSQDSSCQRHMMAWNSIDLYRFHGRKNCSGCTGCQRPIAPFGLPPEMDSRHPWDMQGGY